MKKYLPFIVLFGFLSLNCGYATRSTLPSNIRTVFVAPFKNSVIYENEGNRNIYLPLLEQKVRNEIINRFLFDGVLKIGKEDQSDLILKGELKSYDRSGLRYTDNNDVQEYRITITVSLELWNREKNEMVWSEPGFSGEASYFVSGPQAKTEDAALQDAIKDLARRVIERTVEDW